MQNKLDGGEGRKILCVRNRITKLCSNRRSSSGWNSSKLTVKSVLTSRDSSIVHLEYQKKDCVYIAKLFLSDWSKTFLYIPPEICPFSSSLFFYWTTVIKGPSSFRNHFYPFLSSSSSFVILVLLSVMSFLLLILWLLFLFLYILVV